MERLYPKNAWLTPSELFKPYYSYSLANFMVNQMENTNAKQLRIVEIGPGTGTNADSILEYLKNYHLDLYKSCSYTLVEISPGLALECEALMLKKHSQLYNLDQIQIFNQSIFDFKVKESKHCFVIGLEILDNMPHDRLYMNKETGRFDQQAVISMERDGETTEERLSESRVDISDALTLEFLKLYESMPQLDHIALTHKIKFSGVIKRLKDLIDQVRFKEAMVNNVYAPTATLGLFKHVNRLIPNHQIILADFDCFLTSTSYGELKGINQPIITNKLEGPTKWQEYDTYLIERGAADICFPSDFQFLQHAYESITNKPASVYKN
mmetsp:Transcript_13853/g.23626  ORF Transcript_13853/g.23626 Transcript_13853/m.23626 type:complete len:325 (+) Transcript_13853:229-1203(+)|eukprot:CAMPEP_0168617010 /NCGR_PEP_ID=MMETSP0449_2-20121227/5322_1 /TAXON_ID=1082188 /ORGANISM="Strombidium rassoulzadegani, Strain ras09" /LENGTH=324 /DNA_ID=CAMNT_0008657813 /DNA_START=120 /DNA_END=1094 /DNA_ORIENTATION=-